jgi:hypothetical protein
VGTARFCPVIRERRRLTERFSGTHPHAATEAEGPFSRK